ncbi:beta-L-arabinofuranosidase domain-containing protein [Lutibacter sp.]|uniref:beta-L-arabinofuranosidase domain-containing protein n=1 Tax=Lutibacter sp. TaxID=1925666 RepID=UPI0027365288|nr:beta-L-arabinofuranosidase domain-containing protein [Lutibacter sp.]MDP3312098.1 glycoside hydrolase family 127 protein [Lutibacter sp.]
MTKKITLYFVTAFFSIIVFNKLNAQTINLPKEVKFKFGDNAEWAKTTFNDVNWENHIIPRSFTNDSSYAWYRIRIVIPSSLKSSKGKGIKLRLGKIDDVDQTFFNGKLIGQTGGFPPNYSTEWQTPRIYVIPQNEVQWDKENVIAVRIYNLVGGMGIWEGPFNFEQIGWIDDISIRQNIEEKPNNNFATRVAFINKSENLFEGTIKYWVSNKEKTVLFTETKPVRVQPRIDAETIVEFSDFKPKNEKVFNVGYQINDNNSTLFVKNEQLFILTKNLEIPFIGEVKPLVQNKVQNNFNPISFRNQQYTGYLDVRFTQNLKERLLKVDEEGLTGSYLKRPGIHPWAGEHIGKYLETASNVWKLTGDPELKKQMDRIAFILINTQLEDGYLGTYTQDQYWTSWDVWSHKYNLHGLLGYYAATGYQPALEASKKMGDLVCKTFGNNEGQSDIILSGTHIGMAATSVLDAMVDLYKYTADKKYLDFCYYITDAFEQENGPKVISSMLATGKVKNVANGKAYEMLSNYVGLVKLYEVTGDTKFLKVSEMAWQDVVDNQLYITGTTSSHEHFQDDDYLPSNNTDNMGEGCVTTTWVQLNMNLFDVTGDIKYLNQLEKSVYNQLLGAENPETGCVSYYTPLMNKKPYTCHITCCQSSVPRGIALIPYFTFGNLKNVPTILFYEPANYKETIATINKEEIEATFKIAGNFPESGNVSITVETSKSANFPLALRVPLWCTNFVAKIGKETYKGLPNEMVTIHRNWKSGDKINVTFDMPIQTISGGKSYPNEIALQRGPQVLAFDSSLNSQNINNIILNSKDNIKIGKLNFENKSEFLPKIWIGKQVYSFAILNSKEKIKLVPFAEASQTGGDMRVWLPLNVKK